MHSEGYRYVMVKGHPCADRFGYVLEHRYLVEDFLINHHPNHALLVEIDGKIVLSPKAVVHHKNKKKDDNRLSNLEILESQSEHMKIDNPSHMSDDIVRHS
jgi:hypothetical protein